MLNKVENFGRRFSSVRYLIDGHNLIPHIPGLQLSLADDEQRLVQILIAFCRRQRHQAEVYFDNAPPGQGGRQIYSGLLTVSFVRQGQTADDVIRRRLLDLQREARNWAVVSSDHRIQVAARQTGAKIVRSEDFAKQISLSQERLTTNLEKPADFLLKEDEVNEWLRAFGENSEE